MMKKLIGVLHILLGLLSGISGQVLITELQDPQDNFNNRFVEIANIGANSVDISLYRLERYANSNVNAAFIQVPDGIILPPEGTFVFYNSSANFSLANCTGSLASDLISGNGDDTYALNDGFGIIDIYGQVGTDGTGTAWEYTDSRVLRKTTVSSPSPTLNLSEWDIFPNSDTGDADPCNSHFVLGCQIYDVTVTFNCTGASLEAIISWSELNTSSNIEVSLNGSSYAALLNGDTQSLPAPLDYNSNFTISLRDANDTSCETLESYVVAACPGTGLSITDSIRVMTYNVLKFPNSDLNGIPDINDTARLFHFQNIISEAGPDVILLQELNTNDGATLLANALNSNNVLNTTWNVAPYSTTEPSKSGCIYNDDKLDFVQAFDIPITNTYGGQVAVRPNTVFELSTISTSCPTESAICQYISTHNKAGQNTTDINQRTAQMLDLIDHLDAQPIHTNIVCGGDYNFYADNNDGSGDDEPGYVFLTDTNNSNEAIDVLGGWTRNLSSEVAKYTQSTLGPVDHMHLCAAVGGLDDRFDILFITDAINSGSNQMQIIPGTYRTFGSEGVLHNQEASSGTSPVAAQLEFMSDHYPVILDVEITYVNCDICPNSIVQNVDYINSAKVIEVEQNIIGSNVIESNSAIFYSGGTEVCLDPGFEVKVGATFQAYIDGCQ